VRRTLCDEAIRLGRLLVDLLPDEPEARGLLALMLLHHSRRDTRIDANGVQAPLEEQDRSRWDRDAITEGLALVEQALVQGRPGPLQVQASIAALHAEAPDLGATDWCQIAALYDVLAHRWPSPVVALNRAVAVGMSEGADVGLAALDKLGPDLDGYRLRHAARADLLRRARRLPEAISEYDRAISCAGTGPERSYLERRLREVVAGIT
jgi:RNA polymerase sigma-70 factor (ECF subfamily)